MLQCYRVMTKIRRTRTQGARSRRLRTQGHRAAIRRSSKLEQHGWRTVDTDEKPIKTLLENKISHLTRAVNIAAQRDETVRRWQIDVLDAADEIVGEASNDGRQS